MMNTMEMIEKLVV